MRISRKNFLRLIGGSVLATGAARLVKAFGAAALPSSGGASSGGSGSKQKRWGMAIDFKKCSVGCSDCIQACNTAHNIPQIPDPAHEVKWLWKEPYAKLFPDQGAGFGPADFAASQLMTLCNHCADPPCTRVCPTQATWKREDGIVMMDYHRCIGCRYCMAACPYGSRSFNWSDPRPNIAQLNPEYPTRTKGVVEKCNFCEERLADGLQPACVEACKQKTLVFGDLNDAGSEIRECLRSRMGMQRRPELGTDPSVFYLV